MLGTIIIREMQEYIKSKKLLIGMLGTIILVTITTVINIEDYAKRQQDYIDTQNKQYKNLFSKSFVARPPQLLSILVQGKDRKLGDIAIISDSYIPVKTSGYLEEISQNKRLTIGFDTIDFAFIVRVVLSLFVIFLVYPFRTMWTTLPLKLRDGLVLGVGA
ncbi:MAG: hypothetical protein HOC71_08030 [Candidatus Latescibacteria bacterium]|jgi:hypothetical protein|nr:hypothetical protein [Candidatus Latescibacterota bacterium]